MRRNIIILIVSVCVVMAASFSGAAAYPDEYYGSVVPDGCYEIEAWVPWGWFHDMNPWSMPSPENAFMYFGTLCVDGPVAVLEFDQIASRWCSDYDDPDSCFASVWRSVHYDRHVMVWDPQFESDAGFYLSSVHEGEWLWRYESFTFDGENGVYVEGVFEFVTPLWFFESDDFTRWKFFVRPEQTPVLGIVSGSRRVGG